MTPVSRYLPLAAAILCLATPSIHAQTNAPTGPAKARPKIGLALGGGGALGLAHIGVLKELEARRIPVDYIAGTSMGSIIAGLYAEGMAPDEIQTFLSGLDWNEVLNDETPRRELFFRQKKDDQRYLFELGLNRNGPMTAAGMAAGQKLDNVLQYMALRSAAVTNFDRLPIPFRAVATDLQTGLPHVMDGGNLATAMRASMAVPGVFTPVERDGRLLADGGVVNNLPVDVVKAMGADIVIAVDVGADSDTVDPETLKSLSGILGRSYAIAQRPKQVVMYKLADIGIQPVLAGFTASQFDRVDQFVPKGREAARIQGEALDRLAVPPADYEAFLAKQRRPPPAPARVATIAVTGAGRVSEAAIRGRIHSREGELFDPSRVNRDLMRIYGIGEFEHVLFRLEPREDGAADLVYDVKEKSWGPLYFKYGLNLRSDLEGDAEWSMLLNFTRMSLNPLGAEWRNDIEVGSTRMLLSEFYQPLDARGFLFLAPNVRHEDRREAVYDGKEHVADYDREILEARADFGLQLRQYAELRLGPVWGSGKAKREVGASNLPEFDERYAGFTAGLIVDRQDRTLFARDGYYLQANLLSCSETMGGENDYDKLSGILRARRSFGDHTFIAGLQAGSALGSDLPVYSQFTLGGTFDFAGFAEDQFRGSYLGIGSLGYNYRLKELPSQIGRGVYAMIRFDTGNVWEEEIDLDDRRNGVAVGLGADTAIGPLYIAYGLAEQGYDQWYFSLGTAF